MVRRSILALCLACMAAPGMGAALHIIVDRPRVEMGKYLKLTIRYDGESTVGEADLRQWSDDFVVDLRGMDSESLVDGAVRTTQSVRLYPRATGSRVLERIALGGATAGPLNIEVLPALRNGIDATPRWTPLPDEVWQRQAFEIGVEAPLLHPSNHVAVADPVFPGFAVQTLPRVHVAGAGGGIVRLRWRLTALQGGEYMLDPPALEQRGRGRWRFFLQPARVVVRPLPAYLPPGVPVGDVSVDADLRPGGAQPTWEVVVRNRGSLSATVYGLRSALAGAAGLRADDVVVDPVEHDAVSGLSTQRYRVAVPAWSIGWGSGRSVPIRHFDPRSGRLQTLHVTLPPVWRLPTPVIALLAMSAVLAAVATLFGARRVSVAWWMRRRLKRQIDGAHDAHALRRLLLASGNAGTLTEWAARCRGGDAVARRINAACFAPQANRLPDTVRRAAWLAARRCRMQGTAAPE